MDPRLSGALFGIASALSWGAGDFGGGLSTRRSPVYGVIILGQSAGLLLLCALALILSVPLPAPRDLLWGAVAGVCGGIGLLALYRGLASGRMGTVAPVSAVVSAMVPVLFGALFEGLPAPRQLAGFGVALAAIWLLSRSPDGEHMRLHILGLAVLAGLGFGGFLVVIGRVSRADILWPLVAVKAASIVLLTAVALLAGQARLPSRRRLPLVLLVGVLDAGGNVLYAMATRLGRLDVAAVLSSLYPAVTVLLAYLVLKETISRVQWLGVLAALVAVALIAA